MSALRPGSFDLEGLDATGKSTQMERLRAAFPDALAMHQPSGAEGVGRAIYELTEKLDVSSGIARQFLHLASHAEHYATGIIPALKDRAVLLDRCWWSTVAYGWFGSDIADVIGLDDFVTLAQLPARSTMPDLVFVFLEPWADDRHNTPSVREGYEALAQRYAATTVKVPALPEAEVTELILDEVGRRGLVDE